MPKTPKRNGSHQSKHHSMSVECPSNPDHRCKHQLTQDGAKVVAEALRNLLVAGRSVQSILKNESRKYQIIIDSYPAHEVFFRIENILKEALINGEDVLVNYMGEKPIVPLFTEIKTPNGHLEYQEGVG